MPNPQGGWWTRSFDNQFDQVVQAGNAGEGGDEEGSPSPVSTPPDEDDHRRQQQWGDDGQGPERGDDLHRAREPSRPMGDDPRLELGIEERHLIMPDDILRQPGERPDRQRADRHGEGEPEPPGRPWVPPVADPPYRPGEPRADPGHRWG